MKPSLIVKRRAPRAIRWRKATYVNTEGKEVVTKKLGRGKLLQPLKAWAREQVASGGEHAEVCAAWLRNKGARHGL